MDLMQGVHPVWLRKSPRWLWYSESTSLKTDTRGVCGSRPSKIRFPNQCSINCRGITAIVSGWGGAYLVLLWA